MTERADEPVDEFLSVRGFDTLDDYIEDRLESQRNVTDTPLFYDQDERRRSWERIRGEKRRRAQGALPQAARQLMSLKYAIDVKTLADAGTSVSKIAELLKLSRTHVYRLLKSGVRACEFKIFSEEDDSTIKLLADDLGLVIE
jgi:DNA-directed RNA polymerase specialized sigma subunit